MTYYMSEPKKPAPKNPERLKLQGEIDADDMISYWEFDGETIAESIARLQGYAETWGADARWKREVGHCGDPDEMKLLIEEREETEQEYARRQISEQAAWFKYEDEMKKYKAWQIESTRRGLESSQKKLAELEKEYKNEYGEG